MCTFLDKFPSLLDLWFFGYYEENELGLDRSQVVMQMQRRSVNISQFGFLLWYIISCKSKFNLFSERGNGILTRKDIKTIADRLRQKKRKRIKRSDMRAAIRNKKVVQSKGGVRNKVAVQSKTAGKGTSQGKSA